MATQSEIQLLLNQAWTCYHSNDAEGARRIWRKSLKAAIGEYDGMSDDGDRERLGHLVHAMLDEMGLQATSSPINLAAAEATIHQDKQAGKEPQKVISWLFY